MAKVAVVFPGQGSQYVGMGKAFCDALPQAREIMAQAEAASGLPVKRLCFEGPMDQLTLTVNLQPSVVAVDLICWRALETAGVEPVAVAGHSLGEYPALVACGALSVADCLGLVSLRGRLMDRDAAANPGAMSAIMGLTPEQVAELTVQVEGVAQPANYNTLAQTVITGSVEAVAAVAALAKERGAKAIPLKVSGAWHSPFMAQAGQEMRAAIAATDFAPLARAHVPNTTGAPTSDVVLAKAELTKQLTSPVRWVQTVQALVAMGVDTFIEAGPKNVLAGLIKKTAPEGVTVFNVEDPAGLEAAVKALA